jgi:beta-galactosidase/beta-glucuronidase
MGMLIWDEAFDSWSGSEWTPDYVADLTTFIRRDRNHPSVIIWSTGNEVSDPVLGQQLHDIVHDLDPTRPGQPRKVRPRSTLPPTRSTNTPTSATCTTTSPTNSRSGPCTRTSR